MADWSPESMVYNTQEQAAADIVTFMNSVNKDLQRLFGVPTTKRWLLTGGSTTASIVGRVRSKFPHMVEWAFGDSPILEVTEDFWQFDEKEAKVVDEYDGCL